MLLYLCHSVNAVSCFHFAAFVIWIPLFLCLCLHPWMHFSLSSIHYIHLHSSFSLHPLRLSFPPSFYLSTFHNISSFLPLSLSPPPASSSRLTLSSSYQAVRHGHMHGHLPWCVNYSQDQYVHYWLHQHQFLPVFDTLSRSTASM